MPNPFRPSPPPPGCAPFRYPSDPLQFIAWRDFVTCAIGEPCMREAFRHATGRPLIGLPENPIAAAIDAATGFDKARHDQHVEFIEWLNVSHWGEDLVDWQPLPVADREPADA